MSERWQMPARLRSAYARREGGSARATSTFAGTEGEVTNDYLVIPRSVPAQTMTVSFTAEIWTNGAGAATKSKPISVQLQTLGNGWTAGQCYNYTVTIDGENLEMKPIEFGDPTVTEWPDEPTDIPVEIPM